ncbi:hypothetical protein RB195_016189 [Necator americanus]|uniref:Uncharacterized protein n=1 Tax=Necator americanus TaxID=51031 RepID=A0ABR1E911_NECAM
MDNGGSITSWWIAKNGRVKCGEGAGRCWRRRLRVYYDDDDVDASQAPCPSSSSTVSGHEFPIKHWGKFHFLAFP